MRGLYGLTAIVVSFCAVLQPAWVPTELRPSSAMVSTLGASRWYGFGLPMKLWHSADRSASSPPSSSPSSASTSLSSSLGTLWVGAVRAWARAPARGAVGSVGAGRSAGAGAACAGNPEIPNAAAAEPPGRRRRQAPLLVSPRPPLIDR